ncbi:MAG: MarR family transcriptional regulator [Rhizomicrobium sp.]
MSGINCPNCGFNIRRAMGTLPGLTRMQKEALDAIADNYVRLHRPPTFSQIAERLNLKSKSGVSRLVDGLVERGYVTRTRCRNLTIALTENAWALYEHAP